MTTTPIPNGDEMRALTRQVRRLQWVSGLALGGLLVLSSLGWRGRGAVPELDVERINVRRPDGKLALVISSTEKSPGNLVRGMQRAGGDRGNGIIFYDEDGNEAGGLIYGGTMKVVGRDTIIRASGQLSVDRYESDQVAALRYIEDPREGWVAGLQVSHYPLHNVAEWVAARDSIDHLPEGQQAAALQALRRRFYNQGKWEIPRVFVGERGQTAALQMRDMKGRERIRMIVDSLGGARIEFVDTLGKTMARLP
ncbi:MAG: hypothetical protein JWM95_5109 [Gemmatimonadetes bacterium]|nr:hypothetical protein [Gemmatimonadota bacterium]